MVNQILLTYILAYESNISLHHNDNNVIDNGSLCTSTMKNRNANAREDAIKMNTSIEVSNDDARLDRYRDIFRNCRVHRIPPRGFNDNYQLSETISDNNLIFSQQFYTKNGHVTKVKI